MYMQYARSKVIIIYGDKNTSKSLQKISVYDVNERVQCKDEAVDKTIDSEKNRFFGMTKTREKLTLIIIFLNHAISSFILRVNECIIHPFTSTNESIDLVFLDNILI